MGYSPASSLSNVYFERYAYPKVLIQQKPPQDLGLIITLPAFKEEQLVDCLQALAACDRPGCAVEVIVLINQALDAPQNITGINRRSYHEALQWASTVNGSGLNFHILYLDDLPAKHAGVGLARKIAMDEAARRYEYLQRPGGIIACFDADCACDVTYMVELVRHFERHPGTPGCSIYFEHPLEGELPGKVYEAIIEYELFLRYYVNALRFAGFPLAYQTIGSSMAVRNNAYQKQGGMNRRKAGEDFYFLQRIIALGGFTELNSTKVIPSPRTSDRVPFGTGKAVQDWMDDRPKEGYAPKTFKDLGEFLRQISAFHGSSPGEAKTLVKSLPGSVREFLQSVNFIGELERIQRQSTSLVAFQKQFFNWFDGFLVLKYIHFTRDLYYPNIDITKAACWLLEQVDPGSTVKDATSLLLAFREIDNPGTTFEQIP